MGVVTRTHCEKLKHNAPRSIGGTECETILVARMRTFSFVLLSLSLLVNAGLICAVVFIAGQLHQATSNDSIQQWSMQNQLNAAQEKVDTAQDRFIRILNGRIEQLETVSSHN